MAVRRRFRPWLLAPGNPPGSYERLLRLLAFRERGGRLVTPDRHRPPAAAMVALSLLLAGLVTAGIVINVADSPSRVAVHHLHRRVDPARGRDAYLGESLGVVRV